MKHQHQPSPNTNLISTQGASNYNRRFAQDQSATSFSALGKKSIGQTRQPLLSGENLQQQYDAFNKSSYSAMGNSKDQQNITPEAANKGHGKFQSAFLQAAYRDDHNQSSEYQQNNENSSRGNKNLTAIQMQQLQTMDETHQTSEGRNHHLQAKYGMGDTAEQMGYGGASPQRHNHYGQKYQPFPPRGIATANDSQRISYLQSESSFKSARVSALGRNFDSNRDQYQTENDKRLGQAGSTQGNDMPHKQTAFQGYKRSVQIMPYHKIDMSKQADNDPTQTYWQFKKDGPASGTHVKSSSSDLGMQQRHGSGGAGALNGIGDDGSYQNTDRGPVTYQRAGALASPQSQFGPPKRLTTQKQSVLSASSDNRVNQQQPYLAHLRGKKSVNNYQNQKKVLGQTIDDSEMNSVVQGEPLPKSHRGQGPKTGMRPSLKPAGPSLAQKKQNEAADRMSHAAGWTSARKGDYPGPADRPSDVRQEEQPYFMRSPFNVNKSFNESNNGFGPAAVSPYRNQAAAHYGLIQYQNKGISPRGKGMSRPGTSLGGGIGIRKLSKLDAKEQDDVHEVTEDEDRVISPMLPPSQQQLKTEAAPPHSRDPYASQSSNLTIPFNKADSLVGPQRGPVREDHDHQAQLQKSRVAYTFGKPNTTQHTASHPTVVTESAEQPLGTINNPTQPDLDVSADHDVNHQLRQEYLKVKRELEMLKRSGRQKMKSPIPGGAISKGKTTGGNKGAPKERPTSSQGIVHQIRKPLKKGNEEEERRSSQADKEVISREEEDQELVDPIKQQFEDTRKHEKDSFNQDELYQRSSKSPIDNQGVWQDKVEQRIEKLNQRLSDYYQRANPDDDNSGSVLVHPTPTATDGNDGVFRGSFSRSTSTNRFQNPQQTMTGNRIQFQSSVNSSHNSGTQQNSAITSPTRTKMRTAPKGQMMATQQNNKGKKFMNQIHGLYSAAGARVGSQTRRQNGRKSSAGANIGNGLSKSMKSTPQPNNQNMKSGMKSTHSYKDVQVIEINDSRILGEGPATSRQANAPNTNTRSTINSQSSQAALTQKKQVIQKRVKGKSGAVTANQKKDKLKGSKSGDQQDQRLGMDKNEFRGSFQNKGHRLWAATPQDRDPNDSPRQKQRSRRQQPLNIKSFNSDRSAGSDCGDGYDRQGPEYSASASNNSEDNQSLNDRTKLEEEEESSNEQEQSTIGTQYSQIVNIRTKHRHGVNSRRSKPKSSQRAKKKTTKASEEPANEKNDKRWPVATIDLENGQRTGRGATPEHSRRQRASAREGSSQPKPPSDQAQVILECQRQIQELQAQLQNLTHFPAQGADTSQGSMLLMTPQQQRQNPLQNGVSLTQPSSTLQNQDMMIQRHQFAGTVQLGTQNQLSYTGPSPTSTTGMHMGINTNSMLGQNPMQYQGAHNQHQLHTAGQNMNQMQMPVHVAEFQQYEMRIRHLQEQIREQQMQLQFQEQKHEHALWTQRTMQGQQPIVANTSIEQPSPLHITPQHTQTAGPYQGLSPLPDLLHGSSMPTHHHQLTATAPPGAPQLASFTTPMTPLTPIAANGPQRPGSGIGIGSQIMPPDTSNITQNNSNFFSQINEIARNIDERGGQLIGKGASIGTFESSADKDAVKYIAEPDIEEEEVDVDVQHETDMEMTELDAAKIGNQTRPDGFTGFETSIVDNMPRDIGPSMLEKGSFAPLPEYNEQKFEDQHSDYESPKKRPINEKYGQDGEHEEHPSGAQSPDFVARGQASKIQWYYGNKDNQERQDSPGEVEQFNEDHSQEKDASQSGSKQDQLLVIGFDEKPKGVNPLARLRSPGALSTNDRSRQKQHLNMFNLKAGKTQGASKKDTSGRVALEITHSSRTSNTKTTLTPKGQPVAKINLQQNFDNQSNKNDNQSNKKRSELMQIGDEVPSLQDYARMKSGRAAKMQSARGKHVSPQPRKSTGFGQDKNGSGISTYSQSTNPFAQREKSQPPKQPREAKTKEELARIRKEMMKTKFKDRNDHLNSKSTAGDRQGTIETSSGFVLTTQGILDTEANITVSRGKGVEHTKADLMSRLASGTKAKIDKNQMKRLTKDNYEKLPEILKKKEDAKRQEEIIKKKERAQQYQKELDMRLRNSLRKKKEKVGGPGKM